MRHLDGINWSDHLDATFQVFQLVKALRHANKISDRIVGSSLGYMLSSSICAWKVVGITPSALAAFRKQEFLSKPSEKPRVERGHFNHRRDVLQTLLSSDFPGPAELLRFWQDNDETVLCHTSENAHVGSLEYFPIGRAPDQDRPFFANAKTSYSFHRSYEGEYLKQLDVQVKEKAVHLTTRSQQQASGEEPR